MTSSINNLKNSSIYALLFFFLSINSLSYSQEPLADYCSSTAINKDLEIPQIKPQECIIRHTAYTLSYNETYKQANWVAYELTKDETKPIVKRNNRFVADPELKSHGPTNKDYSKSGYDKGHLAPAADMSWSDITMKESFYFTNISPQLPAFNRGIWKQTEELAREWAKKHNEIYIVTGPIFSSEMTTIGPHKIAVPQAYYKVILKYSEKKSIGIGFIIPNHGSTAALQTFAVTIDSVEQATGIDFFPNLPDNIELQVECYTDTKDWEWPKPKQKSKK